MTQTNLSKANRLRDMENTAVAAQGGRGRERGALG